MNCDNCGIVFNREPVALNIIIGRENPDTPDAIVDIAKESGLFLGGYYCTVECARQDMIESTTPEGLVEIFSPDTVEPETTEATEVKPEEQEIIYKVVENDSIWFANEINPIALPTSKQAVNSSELESMKIKLPIGKKSKEEVAPASYDFTDPGQFNDYMREFVKTTMTLDLSTSELLVRSIAQVFSINPNWVVIEKDGIVSIKHLTIPKLSIGIDIADIGTDLNYPAAKIIDDTDPNSSYPLITYHDLGKYAISPNLSDSVVFCWGKVRQAVRAINGDILIKATGKTRKVLEADPIFKNNTLFPLLDLTPFAG